MPARCAEESIKDNLVAAGYMNSVCEADAAYNLTAVIPPDAIGNGNRRFVWDFTETKGVKTVNTVVTNALVTSVDVNLRQTEGMSRPN